MRHIYLLDPTTYELVKFRCDASSTLIRVDSIDATDALDDVLDVNNEMSDVENIFDRLCGRG